MIEDDFYSEKEQWERVKTWVRENILWVVAGVAIGVGILLGYRWWEQRVETRAVEASIRYSEAIEAFARSDSTRALTVIDELRRDYSGSPYADQGDLAAARTFVEGNDLPKAIERLTRVMQSSPDMELRQVARYRLARVQLAKGETAAALATVTAATPGAFNARYQELRGDILLAKGDRVGALREYLAAKAAETAPDSEVTLDMPGLDLKIDDLRADGIEAPAAAAAKATNPAPTPAAQP